MSRIWPGVFVGNNTLQVHISAVRRALGEHGGMLKTEFGRGYRLIGDWIVRHQHSQATSVIPFPQKLKPESPGGNLPVVLTRLIGRSEILPRICDLVSAYRVVTLTGPGGIGKTSLALQVAHDLTAQFSNGAWLVELASLSEPELVPTAVASVLGLRLVGDTISGEAVARAIGGRNLILVMDNCEHVIDAVAEFVETVLRLCSRLTILLTSREALRVDGEYVCRVAPLDVPTKDSSSNILDYGAVELFLTRANAAGLAFSPASDELVLVATICRQLDGIPLAIEFAAARAGTLGVRQVASGLSDRFGLLTSGRRTALARHQTLRAALDWSYDLLPEPERRLLHRLAIFAGAFSLEAARAIAASPEPVASDIIDGLFSLIAKSLVVSEVEGTIARHRLLDTTRAYALEKLDASGEREPIALRHAEYYRNLFERAELECEIRPAAEWLANYAWCIDNVRAALDWAFSPGGNASIGLALTAAAVPLWMYVSLVAECKERCDRALLKLQTNPVPDMRLRMRLQIGLGNSLLHTRGSSEQAQNVLTEALESAEALGDLHAQLRILLDLSSVNGFRGEYARAATASERARAIAQEIGDTTGVVFADRRMGMILLRIGRLAEAQRCFERVIHSSLGPHEGVLPGQGRSGERAMARAMLARSLWLQGFSGRALQEAQASLGEVGADDHLTRCRVLLYGMGRIAPMTGDFAAAEIAVSSIIESATSAAAPFWTMAGQFLRGKLLVERRQFEEGLAVLRDAFDICNQTGWRLSYPEFMGSFALALAGLGSLDEAHDAICKAMEAAGGGEDGQQWYVPELLRIKGEVLFGLGRSQTIQAAEACFGQAAEMAREQGALFWELRAALSAARLRLTRNNRAGAAQILQPVYDRFTEGFDTADLKEARLLLGTS